MSKSWLPNKESPIYQFMVFGMLLLTSISLKAENMLIATSYDERSPQTLILKTFAQEVQRQTNSALVFDVKANAQLYTEPDILPAVADGSIAIGEVILSSLAGEDPLFLVDNIPFLVGDFDQAQSLWTASKEAISEKLSDMGVTVLYSMPWAPQALYTDEEISSISQLSGKDIRSYSEITEQLILQMRANPVPVPYSDIQLAFESNEIEAMITSATAGVRSQAYLFTSHYTDINAWIPKNIVFINTDLLNSLEPETQREIFLAANEAEARGWRITRDDYFRSRITLSDNGITVRKPSTDLMTQLTRISEPLLDDWIAQTGDEGQQILNTYYSLVSAESEERD